MPYEYIINNNHSVKIGNDIIVTNEQILGAINFCNNALRTLNDQTQEFDINIFEALGMRNLSGIVGEYFAKSVQRFSNEGLHSNLHQDGYPTYCLHILLSKKRILILYTPLRTARSTLVTKHFSVLICMEVSKLKQHVEAPPLLLLCRNP